MIVDPSRLVYIRLVYIIVLLLYKHVKCFQTHYSIFILIPLALIAPLPALNRVSDICRKFLIHSKINSEVSWEMGTQT